MDYETTVQVIKSCIVSVKGGLPFHSLQADFKNITGEALIPQKLGYKTLQDLLISIEEVHLKGNLLIVQDKKTDHLSKLISKQKGQTKIKAVKKSYAPNFSTDSRFRHAVGMRKGPPKALREQAKKIEAEVHRLLPAPPPSTMAAKTAFTARMNEDYHPSNSAQYHRESTQFVSGSNLSLTSSSNTSVAGFSVGDERPTSLSSSGRGRGRGRSAAHSVESPPRGLSENASSRRETSSPDVRSGVTGGTYSTCSLSGEDREPILLKYQLIGEGLLNKVASLILGFKNEGSESRLCCATLDTVTCLKQLKRFSVVSDKVILMLGLTDIMKGKDLDTLKSNLLELLDYLRKQAKQILILTLPVPICVQKMPKPRKTLLNYNEWLLTVKLPQIRVIDLAPYTQNKERETLDFLCESLKLDPWNETACWALVEALFFSNIQI